MHQFSIRALTKTDVQAFRALRLRSLREHPEAFGSSAEEEEALTTEQLAERLSASPDANHFGAFVSEQLMGILGFFRNNRTKTRHKAYLGSMYVLPEVRGQGVGKALLVEAIRHSRALPELEELVLAVTVGNERARSLYLGVVFEAYCVEPRYIKLDGRYFDIEWLVLRL